MSVLIKFPDGTDWFKANWVFRQLASDVSDRYQDDVEVCAALKVAEANSMLDLHKMNDGTRRKLLEALSTVAKRTIEGSIAGWRPHDAREHAIYCEAVSELAKGLEHQGPVDGSPS